MKTSIKRKVLSAIVMVFCLAAMPILVNAQATGGPYDGLWSNGDDTYLSLHERDGRLMVMHLYTGSDHDDSDHDDSDRYTGSATWEAGMAQRVGRV